MRPAATGGAEITGYRVQWKESSGSWDTPADVSETTVTGTAHTITGLTDGTEYSVRVRAVNSEGTGEASSEAAATPVNPTPLTATTHDKPSSHDGQNAFIFELRFSEEFILSYTTLRDHAFTVTGGEVDNARRLEPGKKPPVGDNLHAGRRRRRRRDHSAECHHGLRRRGRHLHKRQQDVVQWPGADCSGTAE